MDNKIQKQLRTYQITIIFSVLFALLGFSYNVWRLEVSEQNSNIRTASFEILLELSKLEQLVYIAHYDGDANEGSPRKGWVKVGLITDLSVLTNENVVTQADELKQVWSNNWEAMAKDENSADQIVQSIDEVRAEIKLVLVSLL
jgi:S1-C subfamily serine protease